MPGLSQPFLGMGPRHVELGKISGGLTKIRKFDILLMYDLSIGRLMQIIKLLYNEC